MNNNWSVAIIGDKIFGRKVIGINYVAISDLMSFLNEFDRYNHGVAIAACEKGRKLISGVSQTTKHISIRDKIEHAKVYSGKGITSNDYPTSDVFHADFYYVPSQGLEYPKTSSMKKIREWAISNKLPYVFQHDNDHAWFSGFSDAMEKKIFCFFLSKALLNISYKDIKLSRKNWSNIKKGIYKHGWTLNRKQCTYKDGALKFTLWGGVPRVSLFLTDEQHNLSTNNIKLTISVVENSTHATQKKVKCLLKNDYGEV